MKHYCAAILLLLSLLSCKKDDTNTSNCFSDIVTTRTILNKQAVIKLLNNDFYIVENGSVDTKLLPCNLTDEFKINNLPVTITGDVKNTIPTAVCCTEDFVINIITR